MSRRTRYNRRLRLSVICLVLCSFFVSCGVTRSALLPHIVDSTIYRDYPPLSDEQVDSLLVLYGANKTFAPEFLEPTLIALSYYPELQTTPIEFKYSKEATTMAARPKPLSMFWRRTYIVVINNQKEFEGIQLCDVPFNAQIGIIGHELAHIIDYENRNFAGVMGILFRYSSKKRKPLFEKEVDRATIERGLGWQLHAWAEYALSPDNGATEKYREFKREHYLSPVEIERHINFFTRFQGE